MSTIANRVAVSFVERSDALGLKGKPRNDAALNYFSGAYSAFLAIDDTDSAGALATDIMVLGVKGYDHVEKLASEA